jgi:hypothetical protein
VPFFAIAFLCRHFFEFLKTGTFILDPGPSRRISVQFFFFPAGPVRAFQLPGNKPTTGEKACFPDGKQQAYRGRKMQQNV